MNFLAIGAGRFGKLRVQAARALGHTPLAFFDIDASAKIEDVTRASSFDQLMELSQAEVVFISTPNSETIPLVTRCIEKGLHVFAEKPPGITLGESANLRRLLQDSPASPVLRFGFNHRFKPGVLAMQKLIEESRLGRVLWVRGRYGKEIGVSETEGWRFKFEKAGGGILIDQGIHMLDLFRYLVGEFDDVRAFISNDYLEIPGVEDNAFGIFRSSSTGVTASIHSTVTQWRYLFSLEIFFEKGSAVLNGLRTPSGNYGDETLSIHVRGSDHSGSETSTHEIFSDDKSLELETAAFFTAIENRTPHGKGDLNDALRTLQMVHMCYDSDVSWIRPEVQRGETSQI